MAVDGDRSVVDQRAHRARLGDDGLAADRKDGRRGRRGGHRAVEDRVALEFRRIGRGRSGGRGGRRRRHAPAFDLPNLVAQLGVFLGELRVALFQRVEALHHGVEGRIRPCAGRHHGEAQGSGRHPQQIFLLHKFPPSPALISSVKRHPQAESAACSPLSHRHHAPRSSNCNAPQSHWVALR